MLLTVIDVRLLSSVRRHDKTCNGLDQKALPQEASVRDTVDVGDKLLISDELRTSPREAGPDELGGQQCDVTRKYGDYEHEIGRRRGYVDRATARGGRRDALGNGSARPSMHLSCTNFTFFW
eukprot:6177758-Pleurochrysis_carterae.AAC.3